jgi:hypothetical protein
MTSEALSRSFFIPSKQTSSAASQSSPRLSSDDARASPYSGFLYGSRPRLVSFESYGASTSTNHVFDLQPLTIILSPNSLLYEGGRALNQLGDRRSPTTGPAGLPCMRADGAGCAASRSFQYSRTANFRAMATLPTPLPRRNFNR